MPEQYPNFDYAPLLSLAEELEQEHSTQADGEVFKEGSIIGWPHAWQRPAATEEAAWKSMIEVPKPRGWVYLGFPWANLIDGLDRKASIGWKLLRRLEKVRKVVASVRGDRNVVTVCQHIHAARFVELFEQMGVTDLFWSHAVNSQPEINRLRIHGFPLYPAQIGVDPPRLDPYRPRKWLASFIGAYNPKIYLSDVRGAILADAGKYSDLLIVARDAWHFDRAVYQEQVGGILARQEQKIEEERRKQEYLRAIRESWFTLCPTGSGPNSIRIFESLALGSIPVILTEELRLPGLPQLWQDACIFEEDSQLGYYRAIEKIRRMSSPKRLEMIKRGHELFKAVSPAGYGLLLSMHGIDG